MRMHLHLMASLATSSTPPSEDVGTAAAANAAIDDIGGGPRAGTVRLTPPMAPATQPASGPSADDDYLLGGYAGI